MVDQHGGSINFGMINIFIVISLKEVSVFMTVMFLLRFHNVLGPSNTSISDFDVLKRNLFTGGKQKNRIPTSFGTKACIISVVI